MFSELLSKTSSALLLLITFGTLPPSDASMFVTVLYERGVGRYDTSAAQGHLSNFLITGTTLFLVFVRKSISRACIDTVERMYSAMLFTEDDFADVSRRAYDIAKGTYKLYINLVDAILWAILLVTMSSFRALYIISGIIGDTLYSWGDFISDLRPLSKLDELLEGYVIPSRHAFLKTRRHLHGKNHMKIPKIGKYIITGEIHTVVGMLLLVGKSIAAVCELIYWVLVTLVNIISFVEVLWVDLHIGGRRLRFFEKTIHIDLAELQYIPAPPSVTSIDGAEIDVCSSSSDSEDSCSTSSSIWSDISDSFEDESDVPDSEEEESMHTALVSDRAVNPEIEIAASLPSVASPRVEAQTPDLPTPRLLVPPRQVDGVKRSSKPKHTIPVVSVGILDQEAVASLQSTIPDIEEEDPMHTTLVSDETVNSEIAASLPSVASTRVEERIPDLPNPRPIIPPQPSEGSSEPKPQITSAITEQQVAISDIEGLSAEHHSTPKAILLSTLENSLPSPRLSRRHSENFQLLFDETTDSMPEEAPLAVPQTQDDLVLLQSNLTIPSLANIRRMKRLNDRLIDRENTAEIEALHQTAKRYDTLAMEHQNRYMYMTFNHFNPIYYPRRASSLSILDLHLQTAVSAKLLTTMHLGYCREQKVQVSEIITGRGLHSKNGPVLKHVVMAEIKAHPDFEVIATRNPGAFTVVHVPVTNRVNQIS